MADQTSIATGPSDVATQCVLLATRSGSQDEEIVQSTLKKLRSRGYNGLQSISCEHHEGMLVLRGCVPSYFLKQLAQEVAHKIPGVNMVVNSVSVDGPPAVVQSSITSD